jgi:hypothetical protein
LFFFAVYFTGFGIGKGSVQMIAVFEEKTSMSVFVMGRPSTASLVSAKLNTLLCRLSGLLKMQLTLKSKTI